MTDADGVGLCRNVLVHVVSRGTSAIFATMNPENKSSGREASMTTPQERMRFPSNTKIRLRTTCPRV